MRKAKKKWLKKGLLICFAANLVLMPAISVSADEETQTEIVENVQDEYSTDEASTEIIQDEVVEEENGQETWAGYTGLINVGGNQWRYQVNGVTQWNYTGLVNYYGTWYYIQNGTLNWNYTGLTNYYGTWYYVQNGVLNWGYTGLTQYYGTWYYVEKGVLNWGYTGLTQYYGTWYYVQNGVLNWNYTGFTEYYGTRYYVEKGILNWNYKAHTLEDFFGTYCKTNLRLTGYPIGNLEVHEIGILQGKFQREDRLFRNSKDNEYYPYDSYKIEGNKLICQYSKVTNGPFGKTLRREYGTHSYEITDEGDLIVDGDIWYRYDVKDWR